MKKNKATAVLELLNSTKKSDHQIAYAVGCHASYVRSLRRKMAHKEEEPKSAELEKILEEWRADADTDAGAVLDAVLEAEATLNKEAIGNIEAILNERGSRYGSFVKHAYITQRLKAVMADTPNWMALDDDMVESLEMIAHKIGRILNGDPAYADSWVDIAGYAQLVGDRLNGSVK